MVLFSTFVGKVVGVSIIITSVLICLYTCWGIRANKAPQQLFPFLYRSLALRVAHYLDSFSSSSFFSIHKPWFLRFPLWHWRAKPDSQLPIEQELLERFVALEVCTQESLLSIVNSVEKSRRTIIGRGITFTGSDICISVRIYLERFEFRKTDKVWTVLRKE